MPHQLWSQGLVLHDTLEELGMLRNRKCRMIRAVSGAFQKSEVLCPNEGRIIDQCWKWMLELRCMYTTKAF